MIGSDGLPNDEVPHPRLWGSFPRVLGRYSRDEAVLTLEDAVRKMTALPAEIFGLAPERGVLEVGAVADIVVFAPETVGDAATFEEPTLPSTGIESVLVAGEVVYTGGEGSTGARPGRLLRRQSLPRAPMADATFDGPHL